MGAKIKSNIDGINPLIIGGVGGSGTRVYRIIAEYAGFNMLVAPWLIRRRRKELHDNWLLLNYFYPKWVRPFNRKELSWFGKCRMRIVFRFMIWLCAPISRKKRWGWKNPETYFLIPFLKELYPHLRFIFIVRDGRDVAFFNIFNKSKRIRKHYKELSDYYYGCLLDKAELNLEEHLRRGLFWSRSCKLFRTAAVKHLRKEHYLVSCFEDLCNNPAKEIKKIYDFLGNYDHSLIENAAKLVKPPPSLKRYLSEPIERIKDVETIIGDELVNYGYTLKYKH